MFMIGALLAMVSVAFGAFGAHALKKHFEGTSYDKTWETGVRYQMYHALGLLIIGILQSDLLFGQQTVFESATILFIAGIVLFSGSLYVLALTRVKVLGAITPLGGLCFIAGWICVAIGVA